MEERSQQGSGGVGDRVLPRANPHGCCSMRGEEWEPDEKGAATAVSGATTNQAVTQSGSCSLLRQLSYCLTLAAKPQVMSEECANITVAEKLCKAKLICLSPPLFPGLPWIHMLFDCFLCFFLPVGPLPANICCQVYHLTKLCCVIADHHYFKQIILAGLSTCLLLLP